MGRGRVLVLVLVSLALVLGMASPASATFEPPRTASHHQVVTPAKAAWYRAEMAMIAPYLHRNSHGVMYLDSAGAIRRGVSGTVVKEVQSGLAAAARRGLATPGMVGPDRCYGTNSVTHYWYGVVVMDLNSCLTGDLTYLVGLGIAVGAVAAALVALVGAVPVAGAITLALAVLGVGYYQLNFCARDGNGIKVYTAAPLPDFWCTTQ
jgi:hypothetical protein